MNKKVPMRQCVGCQEMKSKKEMLRILKTAEDEIVLDATGRKNGRGAYLCFSKECLLKARKNKGLERSLKMAIPPAVYDSLEKELDELGTPSMRLSPERPRLSLCRRSRPTIQKRSSKICVTTTKYPCISMVEKRSWATRWARNSARPWRFWMRDLRRA